MTQGEMQARPQRERSGSGRTIAWPDKAIYETADHLETATPLYPPDASEGKWSREWRAYRTLFGCWLQMFLSWGTINSFGTFLAYYDECLFLRYNKPVLSLIGSLQCFIILAGSLFVGRVVDAGYYRALSGLGALLVAAGTFGLAVVNGNVGCDAGNYAGTVGTQGLILGTGLCLFFVPSSVVAATWFPHHKAIVVGIVASGASAGGTAIPALVRGVGFKGQFRYTVSLIGVLLVGLGVIAFFCSTPHPGHDYRRFTRDSWWDNSAWRCTQFVTLTAAVCFMFFGLYAVFFNLETWAVNTGLAHLPHEEGEEVIVDVPGSIQSEYFLMLMNGSSAFGRIGLAWAAWKYNTLWVHFATTALTSGVVGLQIAIDVRHLSLGGGLAFSLLFGIFSGAMVGLPPASVAFVLGETHPERKSHLGLWIGMMYMVAAPFALVGPLTAGYLVSQYGSVALHMWTISCFSATAFFLFITSMIMSRRRRSEGRE